MLRGMEGGNGGSADGQILGTFERKANRIS